MRRSRVPLSRGGVVSVVIVGLVGSMLVGATPALAAPACTTSITTSGGYTKVAFNTVSGACDWTVPAGVFVTEFLVVGGGGGGGGGGASTAGSGGGGGAVQVVTGQALTPGATVTVTVGAAGTGGALGGGAGGTGGSSSITIGGTTTTSAGGAGGVTNTFNSGGAPVGGANGGGNAGGTAASYSGFNNAGGGGGSTASGSGRNGGAGTTWQGGGPFGAGGGGGSFYTTLTTPANAQGQPGGATAGSGGYNSSAFGQLCSYSATANYGGGGGGAVTAYLGTSCTGALGGSGTVKLRYAVPQSVTFDANGGTGSMSVQQANTTRPLTTNAFARTGYTFAGWATTPGGSVAYADAGNYTFASSTTLYAVWAAIIYNANGGTGTMSNTTGAPGSSVNLSANGFSPVGSPTPTFRGWDTNPNASPSSPTYTAGQSITMPSSAVTLYAIWDPPIVTSISYNANGGGGAESTQSGVVGSSVTLSTGSNMSWSGKTLASWNTSAAGTGTSYALGSTITMPSGGLALFAVWNSLPEITYDANGGTGSVASQTAAAGTTVTLNNGSGLSGGVNTFLGWSADPNATSPTYSGSPSWNISMPAGGLALYAIWNPPIVRTVTYNANGGTGAEASQSDVVGDPVTLAAGSGMAYSGRTLLGWDTSASATSPTYSLSEAISMPTNGLALYAVWSAPAAPAVPLWTLTYDPNGGTCSRANDQAYDTQWITLPDSSVCSRAGYLFTGWNTSANGSGLAFTTGGSTQMTGDNTVFAQWRKIMLPLLPPAPSPSASTSPSPSASASPSPSASASASPSASPSPSASASASPSASPTPSPSGSPGSDSAGPIPAPSPFPASDGVTVQPQRGTITSPDGGSVDPTSGGRPSTGASFSGGSIAIWDGTKWTQSYTDPGVGSWLVVDGKIRFVPVPGFIGTASTTMRVIDNAGKVGYAPVSFTVNPAPTPTPPALPSRGSNGQGPIPAPPALPAADAGVVVQPQGKVLEGPSGTVDPVADAVASPGATIDPGSLVVWDGAGWVTAYDDPGVGTWKVVNGTVVFTPVAGFCGTASTTMKLTDTAGKSGTAPVAFSIPCAKTGSNGTGVIPAPPSPPFDGSTTPPVPGLALSGVANADGGSINAATALAGYQPDLSTLVIWNGKEWVKSFTDPKVGTWQVIGSRIVFTPIKGFVGVARTTFRALSASGDVLQGPVSFTVMGTCDTPVTTSLVVGFAPNDSTVSNADRARIGRNLSSACTYVISGYVQPVGTTANDFSLGKSRAQEIASIIKADKPKARLQVVSGGRWLQSACVAEENRCVIIRPSRALGRG